MILFFKRLRALKIHIPMKNFLWSLVVLLSIFSCGEGSKVKQEIKDLPVDFELKRFDIALANASASDIVDLKKEFPYFFSKRYDQGYWEEKIKDTIQQEIQEQVASAFSDIGEVEVKLELLFKHISYYFPEVDVPKTILVATDVDYKNKVILNDSLLFVSLSTYLGSDHYFYDGIARFHSKNFRKDQIIVDVAHAFAKAKTPAPTSLQFIDHLIYEGKMLYVMAQLLPEESLHEILSYQKDELVFAEENEVNIWEYFVSKEVLFSTDKKLLSRFVDPAPFSKFYLDLDNETPGRIGRYIGYKIVASYMAKNTVSLKSMLLKDAQSLFNNSKYKP